MSFLVLLALAALLGAWVLRPLGLRHDAEGLGYRLLVGLCLCSIPIMVVGSFSLEAAQIALVFAAMLGLAFELLTHTRSRRPDAEPLPERYDDLLPLSRLERFCVEVIVCALLLAGISSLAPVTSWDAGVAHLALASSYVREGRLQLFEGNAYSAYPHLMHSLFAFAFLQGGERAACLLNWVMAALGCAMVYGLGRRTAGRRAGFIAAAMFATAPIFIDQAGSPSLDVAFGALTAGALCAWMAWRRPDRRNWVLHTTHEISPDSGEPILTGDALCLARQDGWLILSAFLAGSACGVRHTGYMVCALLYAAVLLDRRGGASRSAALFCVIALLSAGPWLLRSALLVGNPLYPFFTSPLSPGLLPDANITSLGTHESVRGTGWRDLLAFPWNIIMRPYWYDGWTKSPGALILLLGPVGLLLGGKRTRQLGLWALTGGVCLFFFRQSARYMLPFFIPLMVVAAAGACSLRLLRKPVALLLAVMFVYGLGLELAAVHFKLPAVLGFENREDYLTRRIERYPAFVWMNENLHPQATVLTLDQRSYYLDGRAYVNFQSLIPLAGKTSGAQLAWLRSRHIKYVFMPIAYMEESPGFAQTGVLDMLNKWRNDREHFICIKKFDLPRPRAEGTETVEIYQLRYPASAGQLAADPPGETPHVPA